MKNRIAVIGAGLAGLAAARSLTQNGQYVTLFEKSRGLGGRVATRRLNGCIFDHGAQVIKPGGSLLAEVMHKELPTEALVQVLAPTRPYTPNGTILPPDPARDAERKFVYRDGLTTLAKLLVNTFPAENFTLHFETRIGVIQEETDSVTLFDDAGKDVGTFASVVLTAPAPQSADLLANSRLATDSAARIEALRSVPYSACLSILLGYAPSTPEPPAYALLSEDRSRPLLWLAFEEMKARERAPNGERLLIAQLGPAYSEAHYTADDATILAETLATLRPLFGTRYDSPLFHQVKRWKYSQPRGMVAFAEANPAGSRLVVCGDALRPENGRIHQAYTSGLEAAEFLLAR